VHQDDLRKYSAEDCTTYYDGNSMQYVREIEAETDQEEEEAESGTNEGGVVIVSDQLNLQDDTWN
jgi:hypothetical protein